MDRAKSLTEITRHSQCSAVLAIEDLVNTNKALIGGEVDLTSMQSSGLN